MKEKSFQAAFTNIIQRNKKFQSDSEQDEAEQPVKIEPILAKYRKPAAEAEKERREEEEARLRRIKKEK